jgi:hypothetical protein
MRVAVIDARKTRVATLSPASEIARFEATIRDDVRIGGGSHKSRYDDSESTNRNTHGEVPPGQEVRQQKSKSRAKNDFQQIQGEIIAICKCRLHGRGVAAGRAFRGVAASRMSALGFVVSSRSAVNPINWSHPTAARAWGITSELDE